MNRSDSEEFVRVAVRIRPPDAWISGGDRATGTSVCIEARNAHSIHVKSKARHDFSFDHVFAQDAPQELIFSTVGKYIVDGCVEGYNGTIFAYGQTGSGKTYTMIGPPGEYQLSSSERRGLASRSLAYLFSLMDHQKEIMGDCLEFLLKCSFVELYQDQVYDLLDPSAPSLCLREDIKRGVYVQGAREETVISVSDACRLLEEGTRNRKMASTAMNRESSRSHALFSLVVESSERKGNVWISKTSQLTLVDLAGSERQSDSHSSGIHLKEAGSINTSLLVLSRVINSVVFNLRAPKQPRFTPYRESKLTFLLRDSLGGNARTALIGNVHPNLRCMAESMSTLRFVTNAKQIRNRAIVNEAVFGGGVHELQAEIVSLKEQIRRMEHSSVGPPTESPISSQKFLDALVLIKRMESDNEGLRRQMESLTEAIGNKERSILSFQLIQKLHKSHVENLAKTLAGKYPAVNLESADKKILEEELERWKELVAINPQLLESKREVAELRRQLEQAQAMPPHWTQGNERLHKDSLLQAFHAIKDSYESSETEANAKLLEDQALQIQQLKEKQFDLERTKDDLKEELREGRDRHGEEMERMDRRLSELTKLLKVGSVRRRMMNGLHDATVDILSPKDERKSKAQRRRTLFTPGSGTSELDDLTPRKSVLQRLKLREELATSEDTDLSSGCTDPESLLHQLRQVQEVNDDLETKLEQFESEKLKLDMDSNQMQQQIQERQDRIASQTEETERLCKKIADLEVSLAEAKAKALNLECEKKQIQSGLDDESKKSEHLKQSLSATDKELQTQLLENAKLETKMEKLCLKLEEARGSRDEAMAATDRLSSQKDVDADTIEELRILLSAEEAKVQQLETKQPDRARTPQELKAMEQSDSANEALQLQLESLLLENSTLQKQYVSCLDELRVTRSKAETLESELTLVKRNLEDLRTERDQLTLSMENLQQQLESAEQHDSQQQELLTSKVEGTKLDYIRRLQSLQADSDISIAAVKKQLGHTLVQLEEKDETIKSLILEKRALKEASAESQRLEQLMEAKEEELRSFREEQIICEKQLNDMEGQLLRKNEELKEREDELKSLQPSAEKARKATRQSVEFEAKLRQFQQEFKVRDASEKKKSSEMKAAVGMCEELKRKLERETKDRKEMEARSEGLDKQLAEKEAECGRLQARCQRLTESDNKSFAEGQLLQAKLSHLEEEKKQLKEELQELQKKLDSEMEQNVVLTGHRNEKQKLNYVQKLRKENQQLRQELLAKHMTEVKENQPPSSHK